MYNVYDGEVIENSSYMVDGVDPFEVFKHDNGEQTNFRSLNLTSEKHYVTNYIFNNVVRAGLSLKEFVSLSETLQLEVIESLREFDRLSMPKELRDKLGD